MEVTAEPTTDVTVAASPGLVPRLIGAGIGTESYADYCAVGGYAALAADEFATAVERSGLLGRGGAAFPFAIKAGSVRKAHDRGLDTVLVANGEEGEPTSIKDRWLLRHRPHLVLDGVRLAAALVGARQAYVYVSDAAAAQAISTALAEASSEFTDVTVALHTVEPGYVAGEETAAVRSINGGPAKPTDKPPRPYQHGVAGLPTLVSNVETLANLPFLQQHGADAYRAEGTATSPGTFLVTVTGAGRVPALYEVPHGLPFADLCALHGVSTEAIQGVLMGGYFAGMLGRDVLDKTLDHDAIRGLGSGLGCGALTLLTQECPVAVAASVLAYFDRENAGQCGSCFNGTAAMSAVTSALRDGQATAEDVARLERWSRVLRGRGACATLDGATNMAASLLANFPQDVALHRDEDCPSCRVGPFTAHRPFEIESVVTA